MSAAYIALVGDFDPTIVAHRAINECFVLAGGGVRSEWVGTDEVVSSNASQLERFNGMWCVPGSPYHDTDGALWAIQYARTHAVPFFGTCGGYQHALLEYARNVLGLKEADHAELTPGTPLPLLARMECALVEQSQQVTAIDQEFREIYGADSRLEGFHCSYGLNPNFEGLFQESPMQVVARSPQGQARAFRLKGHSFFIGTAFQPERQALTGSLHPLVTGFFAAAGQRPIPLEASTYEKQSRERV